MYFSSVYTTKGVISVVAYQIEIPNSTESWDSISGSKSGASQFLAQKLKWVANCKAMLLATNFDSIFVGPLKED